MRVFAWFAARIDGQRGRLFPWAPVAMALGIGAYFAFPSEPGPGLWRAVAAAMAALLVLGWRLPDHRPAAAGLLLLLAGFALAGLRTHQLAAPKLAFRYYGPIEGRVVAIDRSQSDALRLTLDRVRLSDVPPQRSPARVRVSLHGDGADFDPDPGQTIILTGHLSPPGGPVEPGGFDFQRQAWFQGLGAVGYSRTPVLLLSDHAGDGAGLALYRLRMRISAAVRACLPGREGAFAAAIIAGDRSALDQPTLKALRTANLAHLLAISGLHMGLLTGFVFAAIRLALAAIPRIALRWPTRKIAAAAALAAGTSYLALSGANVATERAFVMVAVMFLAILADRRAITLRAVALAALIVLTLRPEALFGPGFQMSFAATTALVVVYGAFRNRDRSPARWPKWARFAGGVLLSSFVAGLATAPIAAAHFNLIPRYGLIANFLSVPLMGAVVVPGAVLAAMLAPFGLGWIGLKVMGPAIAWILAVAETVAGWPGTLGHVVAPGPLVLPVLALGALWLGLWQGRARLAGLPVMAAAFVGWSLATRPPVLVTETGGLVGVLTEKGRALSKGRGDSFAATGWLANDGDAATQPQAAERTAFDSEGRMRRFRVGGATVIHATGKTAAAAALAACTKADLVILNVRATSPKGCRVYDAARLSKTGALALYPAAETLNVITARQAAGKRPWSQ